MKCPICGNKTMGLVLASPVKWLEPITCKCYICQAKFELTPRIEAGEYPIFVNIAFPNTPTALFYAWAP